MLKFVRIAQGTLLALLALNFVLAACGQFGAATQPPTPATTPEATEPPTAGPTVEPTGEPVTQAAPESKTYPAAVLAAIKMLADLKGIPAGQITVVSFEAVEWNDSCLGLAQPDEMCLMVITPGYRVILSAGGEQFEFHTSESGSTIRQVTGLHK